MTRERKGGCPSAAPNERPPSVDRVVVDVQSRAPQQYAHGAVVAVVRALLHDERRRIGEGGPASGSEAIVGRAIERLEELRGGAGPTPVINATGVIVHTNLGRAVWPRAAIEAAEHAASAALFLELDQATGRRGRRYREAEDHLVALTGAEDALVTNNNAAALALAVGLAGRAGRVVVSRGELVEIGGGVRIPEIIRRAGARLLEVGTTNRTRAADFAEPLSSGARVVLRVHPSNFRQTGFTETPDAAELARVAHEHGAIVVDDLGSGALLDTAAFGLPHEPLPSERLAAGSDIVTFSGDKLVGGPQAGLVVGRGDLIAKLRRDPLARAVRPDKVTLAAVAATLALYRLGRAAEEIPVWRMIAAPLATLRARGETAVARIADARVTSTDVEATIGGGALPEETLPSVALAVAGPDPDVTLASLRRGVPSVIGRVGGGRVLLDLRTVDPAEDVALADAVAAALAGEGG